MKTTIDGDNKRWPKIMNLTGARTRKKAVDYSFRKGERTARIDRLVRERLPDAAYGDAVDPRYDVHALRNR